MLLRRVIGDVLRARRQDQHRTLREVSTAANVSLGYLSEIERGQKEASSELLAAICQALGSQLSEVLRDASETLALAESPAEGTTVSAPAEPVLVPAEREPAGADAPELRPASVPAEAHAGTITEGTVSVCVRRNGPLRTTLFAVRNRRPGTPRTAELTRPAG